MKKLFLFLLMGLLLISMCSASTWTADLNVGLRAYYNFSTLDDSIDNATNGLIRVGTSRAVINNASCMSVGDTKCFYFDGTADHRLSHEDNNADIVFNATSIGFSEYTYSGWIKVTGSNLSNYVFIGKGNVASWIMRHDNTNELIAILGGNNIVKTVTNGFPTNKWEMWTLTINLTDTCLYFNNTLQVCKGSQGYANSNNYITGFGGVDEQDGNELIGYMDEWAFYNRTLSQAEITQLYNSGDGLTYTSSFPAANFSINITLKSPLNNSQSGLLEQEMIANITGQGLETINNATYYVWFTNGTLLNKTTNLTINNDINVSYLNISNFQRGNYYWNVYACGSNSTQTVCNWSNAGNFSLSTSVSVDQESYPLYTNETSYQNFSANITITAGSTLFAVKLIYNGTSYLGSYKSLGSNQYLVSKAIDIPLLNNIGIVNNSNISFKWTFEFLESSIIVSSNSTERNVNVSKIYLKQCNAGTSPMFANITAYNETNRSLVLSAIDLTFDFWLGRGTVTKNYSYTSSTETGSYAFCSTENQTLNASAKIIASATGFTKRTFYLNKERWNNLTTNISLYLPSAGTNVIVEVKDSGLSPLAGYFVKVYRYYAENNTYIPIIKAKTDVYGQFVAKLIENEVIYQFEFLDSNNVVQKRTSDLTVACRATICVLPFILEDTTNDTERFQNITDYDWTFNYDNTTRTFTFTWNDVSGKSATNWLKVERYQWNGTSVACNTSSTASSGTLTCVLNNVNASYQAQVFRVVGSGEWRRIGYLSIEVGSISHVTYGTEGLFWSFILLMTMIAIGYYYPPVGVGLYLIGSLLLSYLKIIYMNPAIFIAELVIGIAFIWAFARGGKS